MVGSSSETLPSRPTFLASAADPALIRRRSRPCGGSEPFGHFVCHFQRRELAGKHRESVGGHARSLDAVRRPRTLGHGRWRPVDCAGPLPTVIPSSRPPSEAAAAFVHASWLRRSCQELASPCSVPRLSSSPFRLDCCPSCLDRGCRPSCLNPTKQENDSLWAAVWDMLDLRELRVCRQSFPTPSAASC